MLVRGSTRELLFIILNCTNKKPQRIAGSNPGHVKIFHEELLRTVWIVFGLFPQVLQFRGAFGDGRWGGGRRGRGLGGGGRGLLREECG